MANTYQKHNTTEISSNFSLWQEYVDPRGTMSEDEFNALSVAEKNQMQKEMFPDECDEDEIATA